MADDYTRMDAIAQWKQDQHDDLTRLLALPAGHPYLERAVAERLLGWSAEKIAEWLALVEEDDVFPLTNSWAGAGLVVEAMRGRGWTVTIQVATPLCLGELWREAGDGEEVVALEAREAPEAVAKADPPLDTWEYDLTIEAWEREWAWRFWAFWQDMIVCALTLQSTRLRACALRWARELSDRSVAWARIQWDDEGEGQPPLCELPQATPEQLEALLRRLR